MKLSLIDIIAKILEAKHPMRFVATSQTDTGIAPEKEENEGYEDWLTKAYEQDIKNLDVSRKMAKKQISGHGRLIGIMRKVLGQRLNSAVVVSPGSGASHEQPLAPDIQFQGLEYQKQLVDFAKQREKHFPTKSKQPQVWSLWNDPDTLENVGSKYDPDSLHDWESKLGAFPQHEQEKVLYLKHFCGGGTDSSLRNAVNNHFIAIIAATCCSHRYMPLSYKIIGGKMNPKDYKTLAKTSSRKGTEQGTKAQMQIDNMRKSFLEKSGYAVKQGWFKDESGNPEANGGYLIAVRADLHDLVQNLRTMGTI